MKCVIVRLSLLQRLSTLSPDRILGTVASIDVAIASSTKTRNDAASRLRRLRRERKAARAFHQSLLDSGDLKLLEPHP